MTAEQRGTWKGKDEVRRVLESDAYREKLEENDGISWFGSLADGVGLFVVLAAYLDDSRAQDTKDAVNIGGWVIKQSRVLQFSRRWKTLHRGRPFHLTDFDARRSPWQRLSKVQCAELRQGQNDLIAQYAVALVGHGIDLRGADPMAAEMKAVSASRDSYDPEGLCFAASMKHLVTMQEQARIPAGRIALILEDDTVPSGMGQRIFKRTMELGGWHHVFESLSFRPKGPRPLEVADIIATEGMKQGRYAFIGSSAQKEPRRSIVDLIDKIPCPSFSGWYSEETLNELVEEARGLGMLSKIATGLPA